VWLAVLVSFGVRSNIAALMAAFFFVLSPVFLTTIASGWLDDLGIHVSTTTLAAIPTLLFGVGAVLLAKNPEGTVHMNAMQAQRRLQRLSGVRAVPAATALAGRHDPRLLDSHTAAGAGADGSPAGEPKQEAGRS
jgi:branched-chain amino acid transport system permease protein